MISIFWYIFHCIGYFWSLVSLLVNLLHYPWKDSGNLNIKEKLFQSSMCPFSYCVMQEDILVRLRGRYTCSLMSQWECLSGFNTSLQNVIADSEMSLMSMVKWFFWWKQIRLRMLSAISKRKPNGRLRNISTSCLLHPSPDYESVASLISISLTCWTVSASYSASLLHRGVNGYFIA